jgi:hypothetical protein
VAHRETASGVCQSIQDLSRGLAVAESVVNVDVLAIEQANVEGSFAELVRVCLGNRGIPGSAGFQLMGLR